MRRPRTLPILLAFVLFLAASWPAAVRADDPTQRMTDSASKYRLGQVYEQNGDLTTAEEYYRQALDLWPDNQDAKAALERLIQNRTNPPAPSTPPWATWFNWLTGGSTSGYASSVVEVFGWIVLILIFVAAFARLGAETVRLAILRSKGIPLLGLGDFNDITGRLPGLPHQLAANMNDAGLTIYDEKGAVLPDFDFIGDSGFSQAKLLAKLLSILSQRTVQRIKVDVTYDNGALNAAISLVDSGNGYVRYLHVISVNPEHYSGPGELTVIMARLIADTILISLSRDANTRGLLYQRMGEWNLALKEFQSAADEAKKDGRCGEYYQAHLNLGNLYSFLGLQDKSISAYNDVAEKTKSMVTLALIQAAMACSYKNWEITSPPEQQGTYEWLARQSIEKALTSTAKTPLVDYTIACYYSLANQIPECLAWLREAVSGDLGYLDYVLTDPDMENLREWLGDRSPGEAIGLRVG